MSLDKYQIDWEDVEKALHENTPCGCKIAVIETKKILDDHIKKCFPNKNFENSLQQAKLILKNYEKLDWANSMVDKILTQKHFEISLEDTKDIITAYYLSIKDLAEEKKKRNSLNKLKQLFAKKSSHTQLLLKKIIIAVSVFTVILYSLTKTDIGTRISLYIIQINNSIMIKLVFLLATSFGAYYIWKAFNKKREIHQ